MEKLAEGYTCTIERLMYASWLQCNFFIFNRPSQISYLYFQSYSASVLGYTIENAEVFVSNLFAIVLCMIVTV